MAKQLTKINQDGAMWVRPPAVESNIESALNQPLEVIRKRLQVVAPTEADYLKSECIVHLIRRAIEDDDEERLGVLHEALLRRIEWTLRKKSGGLDRDTAQQRIREVISEFNYVLAGGTSDLDLYEAIFNKMFRFLYSPTLWPKSTFYSESLELLEQIEDPITSDHEAVDLAIDFAAAVKTFTPEERKAYLYIEEMGYQAESKDASKVTAATLCGVSGRTIRTWQKQYKAKLVEFSGDKQS
jgi:hypothetical protein